MLSLIFISEFVINIQSQKYVQYFKVGNKILGAFFCTTIFARKNLVRIWNYGSKSFLLGQNEILFHKLKFLLDTTLNLATKHDIETLYSIKNNSISSTSCIVKNFSGTRPKIKPKT